MVFQLFSPLAHQLIGKAAGADAEKGRVVGEGIEDLAVGDPPRHHNVGGRVGLGEHVLDFFAGPDIPVRHPVGRHLLLPLRFQPLAFSDALHDGEGKSLLQSHTDQVDHDVVSGTDRRPNGSFPLLNQSLGISQPYVRAVGQSGNADQIREIFRLGV